MPENSKAPMSLRAEGAFTVKGLQIYNQSKVVSSYVEVAGCVAALLKKCEIELDEFFDKIGADFEEFVSYSKTVEKPGLYKPELADMLLKIKEENYQEANKIAIDEINNQHYGNLENQGKDIYEHVIDFCEEKVRR